MEQKFLRKLYKDPMTKDGEWKILRQLSPEIRAMMRPGRGRRARGTEPGQRSRALTRSSRARQRGSEQGLGGIVGVVSKSEEESIRLLDGKDHYNEWLFVYMEQVRGTRRPGMPQRGRPGRQRGPGAGRRPPSKRSPTK